jgi:16S rRNA (guanine966-N2)-methyltransferase
MVNRKKARAGNSKPRHAPPIAAPVGLRIIGGNFRRRKLEYSGDLRTRPMKDRVREALFNLLGKSVEGKVAIDLFAGTGALALEALSRGASRAIMIERHWPTVQAIRRNCAVLGVESVAEVIAGDAFLWGERAEETGKTPWIVFCSPPYEFYASRKGDMLRLLDHLTQSSPPESLFAIEADDRFDLSELPNASQWDIRPYPPAIVSIWEKGSV